MPATPGCTLCLQSIHPVGAEVAVNETLLAWASIFPQNCMLLVRAQSQDMLTLSPSAPSLGVHRLSDESPTTTTTTTLPTPIIDLPSLHIPQAHSDPTYVLCVTHLYSHSLQPHSVPRHSHPDDLDVASKSNSTHWPWDQTRSPSSRLAPPGAPLLKDLDSFTEGSSVGSFDFSLPPSPSSPNTYYQPERAFPMAPDPQDLTHAIETWRDGVIMSAAGPRDQLTLDEVNGSALHRGVKRHHSCMFSDGEWDEGAWEGPHHYMRYSLRAGRDATMSLACRDHVSEATNCVKHVPSLTLHAHILQPRLLSVARPIASPPLSYARSLH